MILQDSYFPIFYVFSFKSLVYMICYYNFSKIRHNIHSIMIESLTKLKKI